MKARRLVRHLRNHQGVGETLQSLSLGFGGWVKEALTKFTTLPVLPSVSYTDTLSSCFPHPSQEAFLSQECHCSHTSVSMSLFHVNIPLNSLSKHRLMLELLKQPEPWLTGNQTGANSCTSLNIEVAGEDEMMTSHRGEEQREEREAEVVV